MNFLTYADLFANDSSSVMFSLVTNTKNDSSFVLTFIAVDAERLKQVASLLALIVSRKKSANIIGEKNKNSSCYQAATYRYKQLSCYSSCGEYILLARAVSTLKDISMRWDDFCARIANEDNVTGTFVIHWFLRRRIEKRHESYQNKRWNPSGRFSHPNQIKPARNNGWKLSHGADSDFRQVCYQNPSSKRTILQSKTNSSHYF